MLLKIHLFNSKTCSILAWLQFSKAFVSAIHSLRQMATLATHYIIYDACPTSSGIPGLLPPPRKYYARVTFEPCTKGGRTSICVTSNTNSVYSLCVLNFAHGLKGHAYIFEDRGYSGKRALNAKRHMISAAGNTLR